MYSKEDCGRNDPSMSPGSRSRRGTMTLTPVPNRVKEFNISFLNVAAGIEHGALDACPLHLSSRSTRRLIFLCTYCCMLICYFFQDYVLLAVVILQPSLPTRARLVNLRLPECTPNGWSLLSTCTETPRFQLLVRQLIS